MSTEESKATDETDDLSEKEKNILKSLPSRQISTWKRRATNKRQKSQIKRQKSVDGRVYMPVDASDDYVVDIKESGKYIEHAPLSDRLKERRLVRSESISENHSLSCFKAMRYGIEMSLKIAFQNVKNFLSMFGLWRGHFKEIEGSFGNGILSFFTFLRWLLYVNLLVFVMAFFLLVIPQVVSTKEVPAVIIKPDIPGNSTNATTSLASNLSSVITDASVQALINKQAGFFGANTSVALEQNGCHVVKPRNKSHPYDVGAILSDFMQGMGWINTTVMFYGSYSSQILIMPTGCFYNMPMAYFTVSTASFVIVLLLTLWSASSIIEESYIKDGVKHYNSYSNKIFGGWDMCITDENAAKHKVKSLVREIEGDLAEDFRLANLSSRTRKQRCKIYSIRLTINLVVLLLSVGAGWAIYEAAQLSLKAAQTDLNASNTEFLALCKSYASSITLTVLNSILPALFYFLSQLEDWNPRVHVNIDLARTVLLKLSSVAVLLISLFQKIDNDNCILCWENAIAAEMYKLIWMDFLVVIAVAVAYHTPRRYVADNVDLGIKLGQKIGRPIFLIPQNVLELVYAQCLIWIGMWYSPLLTLMGCIKFFILFYVKKLTLKYNCRTEDKPYRAGKSNYFFMLLLLVTFFLCVAAVVYGVSQIRPSMLFGPFRGLDRMYSIVALTIKTLPIGIQNFYEVIQSPVFIIIVVILICLGLYFFYASAKVYYRMITELQEELAMETRDKKYLLKKLGTT